ncbi:hypothetical protein [Ammoniphilus sp. YIM 78166]|uniref:hypothetical protein n=1 Tax=Ammoniphilus sp. YIM 78166 TaxID=1644106 RepID=UPI00106FCD74|nr:hypothetical protein [Ammoniphilus sp. YIM 78166]
MNQAILFLQERKQELEAQGEWTPSEQSEYEQIEFTLSFFMRLQEVDETTSYTKVLLMENVHPHLLCQAILLTPGGVYLFYLLPLDVQRISVLPNSLIWATEKEEGGYQVGRGGEGVRHIQREKGLVPLPVYEYYIVPGQESNIRYVLNDALVLSEEHVPPLFSNFFFREHLENQESQAKLLHYLTHAPADLVSREDPYPKLPPRQRRRRQKESGWLTRLFSGR